MTLFKSVMSFFCKSIVFINKNAADILDIVDNFSNNEKNKCNLFRLLAVMLRK